MKFKQSKIQLDEVQEQLDFVQEHPKKNVTLVNFYSSINKEIITDIEKNSKVELYPVDTETSEMIDFMCQNIEEYSKNPNHSQFIKDAILYYIAENYSTIYSRYMYWKEKKS